jgi:hypothetical protein
MAITDAQYAEWLKKEDAQRVLLVEAKYYDSGEQTAYLASMPFCSKPTDTPANTEYQDVVIDIPKFSCALGDALQGYTVPSWGDIIIDNSEFSRDAWLGYGWDGRAVSVLFGDQTWPRAWFKSVMTGTISGISVPNANQVKMSIKDNQWALNTPIQNRLIGDPTLVSGTTYKVCEDAVTSIDAVYDNGVLLNPSDYTTSPATTPATFTLDAAAVGRVTAEYTGGATASGDVIPLCYGEAFNISPKCLSTALLVYQVHDGPVHSIVEVRDNGIPIEFTADLTTGRFTLLSKPIGTVTCDVQGATSGGVFVEGIGRIIRYILIQQTDLPVTGIDSASLRTFINDCPQRCGIYINTRRNTLDVIDDLIKSVGGFYTPGRDGRLVFGQLDNVPGASTMTLTADDIVQGGLKIVKQSVPCQTTRLAYLRNYTPQENVCGAVTDADRAIYAQQWRYATKADPSIKTAHLLAAEPDAKQTYLALKADAVTEAERQQALNGPVRTTYSAECITLPLTVNLGDVITLTHPRYGLGSGKLVYVVGINESIINRRVTLTLWG